MYAEHINKYLIIKPTRFMYCHLFVAHHHNRCSMAFTIIQHNVNSLTRNRIFADICVPDKAIGTVGNGFEAFLLVDESVNREQLLARFQKAIASEEQAVKKSEAKLGGSFAQHAPAEVVQTEKDRLEESRRRIEKLRSYVVTLQS